MQINSSHSRLCDPAAKYDAFPKVHLPHRKWPNKSLTKPPRWLPTDLRDGNQSLVQPMDSDTKLRFFQALVKLGYKEIEVSYPSSSQTDFDFTKRLIETPNITPDDVCIQVMSPCREELIRQTVSSVLGAKKVTIHIYLATAECFRRVVFNMTEGETLDLAVRSAKLVRELTKDSQDPAAQSTEWMLELTPEVFQDTPLEFALRLCEAVKAAWEPTVDLPIIFNLPATVEMAMPNVFADQIECFCESISEREKVCVSLHSHNDRGCAVAATEMAQLAGADRVEGCLFGNGERTGNVDLITLALNLYTQGIHPGVNFSDINSIISIFEESTKIPVHVRAPYVGKYVFCTFTGAHQDAIRKGYKHQESTRAQKWKMPYIPLDPQDLGREHEAIIRVNSQSGKSGSAWLVKEAFHVDLPRDLEVHFSQVVQTHADILGDEVTLQTISNLFQTHYMLKTYTDLELLDCKIYSKLDILLQEGQSQDLQSGISKVYLNVHMHAIEDNTPMFRVRGQALPKYGLRCKRFSVP
ncbi:hypothetical protein G7Y89_g8927 [Cudoniella acicularis]|uniref:2-isopropylmalate synthase n=1 Tax=Cudoniella acicularis TaxID=354080 RepID=A0A8H4RFM9_9HELO|nr:hypothetical protein G7Y89_g8927 [Cudoniella acicularis]